MLDYKTVVTIQDPNQLVLTSLPFRRGQRVEVVLRFVEEERAQILAELRMLLAETQAYILNHRSALPQAKKHAFLFVASRTVNELITAFDAV